MRPRLMARATADANAAKRRAARCRASTPRYIYAGRAMTDTQAIAGSLFGDAPIPLLQQLADVQGWVRLLMVIAVSCLLGITMAVSLFRTYQYTARLPTTRLGESHAPCVAQPLLRHAPRFVVQRVTRATLPLPAHPLLPQVRPASCRTAPMPASLPCSTLRGGCSPSWWRCCWPATSCGWPPRSCCRAHCTWA